MLKRIALVVALLVVGAIVLFAAIQLVPYGKDHTNLPVVQEPNWDSQTTRALVKAACFDCHSNETVWPWYSNIAPVSWLVARDVFEGREKLNFSEWGLREMETDEIFETTQEGEMPPVLYLIQHPEARFSQAEKQALLQGIQATFGGDGESGGGSEDGGGQEKDD